MTLRAFKSIIPALYALLLLTIASCESSSNQQYQQRLDNTSGPARHAIRSDQLQDIMGELAQQVAKNWPQEVETEMRTQADQMRQKNFEKAHQLGQALAQASQSIPDSIANSNMSENDLSVFLSSAGMLRWQALALAKHAEQKNLEGMQHSLNIIQTTCYGCHTQFRQHAGPLKFGQ